VILARSAVRRPTLPGCALGTPAARRSPITRNISAGPITCDYNGVAKHRTTIGVGTSIGFAVALAVPVTAGDGAIAATGSVTTEDVEANALAIARGRQ
jgi:bifunctional N-acetylglucosamine-1-phosphate-uridyltransferase/glucosamine-1-phosphate-acetyltransferase GlmU-like protein